MEKNWWKKAVVYQIYPKSFCDSNGDGIGDLNGIIQKLDYLKELGINTLWICPVYLSPMDDNGYDVADYYKIDPMFGDNKDMEMLIEKAKERDISVIMDLVVNHCSDEHEWFRKAKENPEGEYGKYFYFRKGKEGNPPNNWRSIFGGSAWEQIEETEYYYLHLFSKKQPDLNWENPKVREEIYRMINWWLEKGVAGFRMDAISYMKKNLEFPCYPADGEDGMASVAEGTLNYPGLMDFLKEMKEKTYGLKNTMTVGEVTGVTDETLFSYIDSKDGVMDMIFDFSYADIGYTGPNYFWFEPVEWSVEELKNCLFESQKKVGTRGWLGLCLENHDLPRCIDRLLPKKWRNYYGATMLAMMYMMLRGTPFIYQGQEIGMRNIEFPSIECYDDCSSHNQFRMAVDKGFTEQEALSFVWKKSRDNTRIPFQWDSTLNAGFTTGTPWLPIHDNYEKVNAKLVISDSKSLWNWYKKLIELRLHSEYSPVFCEGTIRPVYMKEENIIAYERSFAEKEILVLCNYQERESVVELYTDKYQLLMDNYETLNIEGKSITLRAYEAVLIEMKS